MSALEFPTLVGHAPELSNEDYHAAPGISSGGLIKVIQQTPAHYKAYISEAHEPTEAMLFGTAVHSAILEPDLFNAKYVAKPEGMNFATIEGKAWKSAHKDKEILSFDKFQAILLIRAKIFGTSELKKLFTGGQAEQSYFWEDEETGLVCKCRPDYFDGRRVIDIKTSDSASPQAFRRSITKWGFHIQSRFYLNGLSKISDSPLTDFVHVVIEKEPPYEVACYVLDDASLERAQLDISRGMGILNECIETNNWPGYQKEFQVASLPSWAWNEDM